MVTARLTVPTETMNSTLPYPHTNNRVDPIPFTVHESDRTGLKVQKKERWSLMCWVAPESANQSKLLRPMKQENEK